MLNNETSSLMYTSTKAKIMNHDNVTTMDLITVNKQNLLLTLKENQKIHDEAYANSQLGYRKVVIKTLQTKLKDVQANKEIDLHFGLVGPVSYTDVYTTAIGMLEWCLEDIVQLTRTNYENFVLDEWSWSNNFKMASGLYHVDV